MNPVLQHLLSNPIVRSGTCSGISPQKVELLMELVTELRPRQSLEVGLAYGTSALAICEVLPPGSCHIVIDPYQTNHWEGRGLQHLQQAGHADRIEFYEDFSYRVLPQIEAKGVRVDFAFIDGRHTFDYVLVDFFHIDKMLNPGGVVLFDDADWPSIRRVLRFIVMNLPYQVYKTLPANSGQASRRRQTYDIFAALCSVGLNAISQIPGFREPISRAFGGDLRGIDKRCGLMSPFIALRKVDTDRRGLKHFEFF
ncbi:MAG: class I SAM-dependent methyltransferase [Chloroflexi bacterium]|nr:class I SAM-dependent methyltransferase [Chloroflexota bacterium]